jgi:hypothetical protein
MIYQYAAFGAAILVKIAHTRKFNEFWESAKTSKAPGGAVQRRGSIEIAATTCANSKRLRWSPSCRSNGSKLEWSDRNRYLAIRRLLDGEINFL